MFEQGDDSGSQAFPPPAGRESRPGVVVSEDGYIPTNNHVVEGADANGEGRLRRWKNEAGRQKIIGKDPRTDLAVLKVEE